jgi:hypothetical protein
VKYYVLISIRLINSTWNKEELPDQWKSLLLYQFTRRAIKLTVVIVVGTRVGKWDFVMDKSGAAAGFLRELRFPLPIYFPSYSPQSSSLSPEAGTIGQEWPQCL